jgi:N-acetylmuramoyl-L-alanine amidase
MSPYARVPAAARLPPAQLRALTAYGEARNQPVRGLVAVMAVIDNRVRLGRWGTTVAEVVLARRQFSCWNPKDPNYKILTELADRLLAAQPIGDDIVLQTCCWLADQPWSDPTHGATHYYAPLGVAARPTWALPPAQKTVTIRDHVFFTNVP